MNETVVISLRELSAHLAKCAILACSDEPPPHISMACQAFRTHFPIRFYLKDIEEYTKVGSQHSLEVAVRESFRHVPEILAWGARKHSPINLDYLAIATAKSYWKESQPNVTSMITASASRLSLWKRFTSRLRLAA